MQKLLKQIPANLMERWGKGQRKILITLKLSELIMLILFLLSMPDILKDSNIV